MRQATALPVTVKHRIGIDGREGYDDLEHFVRVVAQAGCDRFTVHARIAVLQGLSPKENRTVPPLRYADVYRLKARLPELRIEVNGGITTFTQIHEHLAHVDGVMVGRAAYDQPFLFATADAACFGDDTAGPTRRQVLEAMIPYIESWLARGCPAWRILRHMLGLFAYQRAARAWKRHLSQQGPGSTRPDILLGEALRRMPDDVLEARPLLLSAS
jgi:tRNA-dihydrouridine synthase A